MIVSATPEIFGRMASLTDPLRGRILLVLERTELTVTELCSVFQVPQSTMSRHLKALTDEGWLSVRAEGTSRHYRLAAGRLPPEAKRLWRLVRDQVVAMPAADQDAERVRSVVAERRERSQAFFSSVGGEWDRIRQELVGRRLDLLALLGLLDERWVVGDLGCGTGLVAEILAPFVQSVIAIDSSPAMLVAARERLTELDNAEVREGELEALPVEDLSLDAAVLFLVLPYVPDPEAVVREAVRVLRPGGRLLIADLRPHDREEYRQAMGHLWLGFGEEEVRGWLEEAGIEGFRYLALPPDPDAKGPGLFVASGRTPREEVWIPGQLDWSDEP